MPTILTSGVDYAQFFDDLRAVIRYEVSQQHPVTAPAQAPEELLTIRQAAQLLDVCPQTLHEWKRKGLLPYQKLGGRTYLKKADVLAAPKCQQRTPKGKGARRG
ncbi:helix-turn-helix domain-containing protein [Hymenobacter guriensis]|uniref:Helix-turn-helix domain-containing protein n=1 Tax=Hymenobacter guriensis TaxID=2793065 RepID=A0ABS0KXK1_9BACT|nr:helix-turn-helix domain-containing protein [Hymenobacter guriensis]MBG8552575.1 helix-turn-helix domain-containing protein [Hymenobacter guriensis]